MNSPLSATTVTGMEWADWIPLYSMQEIPAAASGIPTPPRRNQRQRRRDHRRTRPHGWKGGAR